MKERSYIAVCFVIVALLFSSATGYSKTSARKRVKRAASHKTVQVGQKYTVRAGDNLGKIARNFGTTQKAIQAANNLKNSKIKAGQTLSIPASKSAKIKKEKQPVHEVLNTQNRVTYMSAATTAPTTEQAADSESLPARVRLVQAGFEMLGVRYRLGGSGTSGIDCSGLVKNLFSKFNIDLPRSSKEQYKQGEKVSKDDLQVGDLVFFSSGGTQPTHVGIYIGNNQFIHAARKAKQVVVSDFSKLWYTMRYLGARRIAGLWGDEPVAE
jgi:cell wall-associated NlpC family hydrolase